MSGVFLRMRDEKRKAMTVKVRNGNVEAALRVFKRKYSERVFEYRERKHYEKPSILRSGEKKPERARKRKQKDGNNLEKSKNFYAQLRAKGTQ